MKEIKITSNGIKQAIDDLVNENEMLQDKIYKQNEEIERLNNIINTMDKEIDTLCKNQKKEIERLNNIINRLEEFIEKEIELYTIELTEKNTNALSYSLPIKAVYKEIFNIIQKLKGSGKSEKD